MKMEPTFITAIWVGLFTFAGISVLLYLWTRLTLFKYFSVAWVIEAARTTIIDFNVGSEPIRLVAYLAYIPVTWVTFAAVAAAATVRLPKRLTLCYFTLSAAFVFLVWFVLQR